MFPQSERQFGTPVAGGAEASDSQGLWPAAARSMALPFAVSVVRDEAALAKAVQVRHAAYARHLPEFAERLRLPEPDDTADDCVVLLAESKRDGKPLGSMRLQVNDRRPLPVQRQVSLPPWLSGKRLADAYRFSVASGPDATLVKLALFKAYFLRLQLQAVDWSVIAARRPLTAMYEALQFEDVLDGQTFTVDPALKAPHRLLALEITGVRRRWALARHPLLGFTFETAHPDIDVGAGVIAPGVRCVRAGCPNPT